MMAPRPPIDLPAAWDEAPVPEPLSRAARMAVCVCAAILGAGIGLALGAVWLNVVLPGVPG